MSRTTRIRTARLLAVSLTTAAVGFGLPAAGQAKSSHSTSPSCGKSADHKPAGTGGGRRMR